MWCHVAAEKIRPLDSKLRNQIEKLVRMAAVRENTAADGSDPLAFRPNPDALVSKVQWPTGEFVRR
jgi:hypothetical protein